MKIIEDYCKKYEKLQKFREENKKILEEHFRLEEEERRGRFILIEKIEMMIEEGKIKKQIFYEDKNIEIKIDPKKQRIVIFEKKRYGNKKQKNI